MATHKIMAILINKRTNEAPDVQEVLTEYGCIIKARIGLHETDTCSEEGLIILKLKGDIEDIKNLKENLNSITGVKVKKIELGFE